MAQYIQIKNPETNTVETKAVATILTHLNRLSDDGTAEVINELPVHTMLHSIRKNVSNNGRVTLDCLYHVTFENRLFRVRNDVLMLRIPEPLRNLLNITTRTEGIYMNEFEGLVFKITLSPQANSFSHNDIKYVGRGRKVLPNIYDDSHICFGSTTFRTQQSSATLINDVGRMLQSYFASTFNNDLNSTRTSNRARTKSNIIEFLRENGHTNLARVVEGINEENFLNVYTIWAIASLSKKSLSKFQSLIA